MVTIFTPTYNRAYVLFNLYKSLCEQSNKDFEWLIVDDGSTDNTKSLVESWILERRICIKYFYQQNFGKPVAHNRGVAEAQGEIFTCVDSDDTLVPNAIEKILTTWAELKSTDIIGILAFRKHYDGKPITQIKDHTIKKSTLRDAYKKHGLRGDTMLIFNCEIIKQMKFPMVEGEKFIPETYLYNQLDKHGCLYILREYLYVCDYLNDGYTKNIAALIYNNYKSYSLYINEQIQNTDVSVLEKYLDSIRCLSVMIAHKEKGVIKRSVIPALAIFAYIPAFFIAILRFGHLMKLQKDMK